MDVCDLFKQYEISTRLGEVIDYTQKTGREYSMIVCKNHNVYIKEGSKDRINGNILEDSFNKCNNQVLLDLHTHPNSYAIPSRNDLISATYYQPELSCVYGVRDDNITCYKAKGELSELGKEFRKAYEGWYQIYNSEKWKHLKQIDGENKEYLSYYKLLHDVIKAYNDIRKRIHSIILRTFGRYPEYNTNVFRSNDIADVYHIPCKLDDILSHLLAVPPMPEQ